MLALTMSPTVPQDPAQRQTASVSPSNSTPSNKRAAEHPDPPHEMLAVLPQPALNKRPKLSLQTSSLPITFGKSTTALVMAANILPTGSPTVLNTFNNAYDLPSRPSPATNSPFAPQSGRRASKPMASYAVEKSDWPYELPLGLKSILRNSPLPAMPRRSSVYSNTSSPRHARRMFFPPTKKVCYRSPLDEEIKTVRFVARHSDLSSSEGSAEDSDSDCASEAKSQRPDSASEAEVSEENDATQQRSRKRPRPYSHRQIRAAALRDGFANSYDPAAAPKTPLDRKRKRRWQWTLGPLDESVELKTESKRLTTSPRASPGTSEPILPELGNQRAKESEVTRQPVKDTFLSVSATVLPMDGSPETPSDVPPVEAA